MLRALGIVATGALLLALAGIVLIAFVTRFSP